VAERPVEHVRTVTGRVDHPSRRERAGPGVDVRRRPLDADPRDGRAEPEVDAAVHGLGGERERARPRADDRLVRDHEASERAVTEVRQAAVDLGDVDELAVLVAVGLRLGEQLRERLELLVGPRDEHRADALDRDAGVDRVRREQAVPVPHEPPRACRASRSPCAGSRCWPCWSRRARLATISATLRSRAREPDGSRTMRCRRRRRRRRPGRVASSAPPARRRRPRRQRLERSGRGRRTTAARKVRGTTARRRPRPRLRVIEAERAVPVPRRSRRRTGRRRRHLREVGLRLHEHARAREPPPTRSRVTGAEVALDGRRGGRPAPLMPAQHGATSSARLLASVRPANAPVASERHHGAARPARAGTNSTESPVAPPIAASTASTRSSRPTSTSQRTAEAAV
jgi:hypothetical protein